MKQLLVAILTVVAVISLIVAVFTFNQVYREQQRLTEDLNYRSTLLAESLKEAVESDFINRSPQQLQGVVDRFGNRERFVGVIIYDNKGQPIATSSGIASQISDSKNIAADAMDANGPTEDFIEFNNEKLYLLAIPLHNESSVVGGLMVAQNASYIDERISEIWQNNLIRLFIQASLLSLAVILIIRWIIYTPIKNLVESLRLARIGNAQQTFKNLPTSFLFRPLISEIFNIGRSLQEARLSASEEARLRLEKFESPWTNERLREFVKGDLKDRSIIVVSNREPYVHTKENGKIHYYFPASGMATAIEPIMQSCGGEWIAYGSGNGDKLTVDKNDKLLVPPDEPKYVLKRVWLTDEEVKGYLNGMSNEGLWPLCHIAYTRPTFRKEDWEQYKKVNGKFAQAILTEIKNIERPIIFVQDFHLALIPRMIKNSRPDAVVAIFWHTPWPNSESFSVFPWKSQLLDGILGSDLVAFHTQLYCNNFIDTVERELESQIDSEHFTITKNGHTSYIKPFPISIAFPNDHNNQQINFDPKEFLKILNVKTKYIGVGVDRVDFTKGILERFKAIEIFLKKNSHYQHHFTFIQIAAPSRNYQQFELEIEKEADRVNRLFKKNNWKPILLLKRHHSHEEVNKFYKIANFCLVTSLHDGMNLVAKEFVASRDDEKGVLILSQFTGASRQLKEALIVNPYNGEQTADAIKLALEMSRSEQTKRMKNLREGVKNYNIYRWSAEILKTLSTLG